MKNNLPILNYVTLPRLGAFHAIIDELTPLPVTKYGSSKDETSNYEDSGALRESTMNGDGRWNESI